MSFIARPENARIHQAIKETIDQVNTELRLCVRLKEEGDFRRAGSTQSPSPPRSSASRLGRCSACGNAYEFINGSFRPIQGSCWSFSAAINSTGATPSWLFANSFGNAFDAVKESIALQRYGSQIHPIRSGRQFLASCMLSGLKVELRADGQGAQSVWLFCEDSGVGMTKSIIEQQLLVAGTGRRHFVLDLERRCASAGFSMERTGQFGIGVLCYFMLADRVLI